MNDKPVAFITGSGRGIGRATAVLLAGRGYDVAVHYRRDAESAATAAAEVERAGGAALVVEGDIAEPDVPGRLLAEVGERFGRLDVLVANAASSVFRPLLELTPRHVDRTMHTTVQSFLLLTQAAVPLMEGRPGTIVALSGYDTIRVMEDHGLLAAAKASMEAMVRQFAVELAPRDIAVNGLIPGFVDTESMWVWARTAYPGGEEALGRYVNEATPAGRWFRGVNLVCDGGPSLPWA